jgi:hypothetical protein
LDVQDSERVAFGTVALPALTTADEYPQREHQSDKGDRNDREK